MLANAFGVSLCACCYSQGCNNPGLELVNAFGVCTTRSLWRLHDTDSVRFWFQIQILLGRTKPNSLPKPIVPSSQLPESRVPGSKRPESRGHLLRVLGVG